MKCFSVEQQRKAQIIEFFYTKNELVKFNKKKKTLLPDHEFSFSDGRIPLKSSNQALKMRVTTLLLLTRGI